MAYYDGLFNVLGLRDWCDASKEDGPLTMAQLLARANGASEAEQEAAVSGWNTPFPSLDNLHDACGAIGRTRDMTSAVENGFLVIKGGLKQVLDPITEPLSWALDGSLWFFESMPWFLMIPLLLVATYLVTRTIKGVLLVAVTLLFMAIIDHYSYAAQTLSIIFVCTGVSVLIGVPVGILMSKNDKLQRVGIPILDMLQTLPTFVYLIPLIFLFSVTESKLYGIAIILYAVVPIIRLTDLGIRLVDKDVIEAANAFGMSTRQKLFGVEIPLALPTIMAGLNQTIMMSLAMVVIASLVSAPGLGVLVLRGIRNLELGVGLVSGVCIVLLAIMLDRVSKAALSRINVTHKG
ncbi:MULTISPECIES: ABC transporter permease [unclassified Lentilitoribacter]|jgi:glycine betaine/proline transport system permease protein|uniref:ABC transporter permease n=1 Tax=unclassified Lentilitoribacter TaxID=2647570 RepID=UPI0013A6B943|nr:ABC transporter permease subunit [Lentilitoribacter sp. Alg239-R112]